MLTACPARIATHGGNMKYVEAEGSGNPVNMPHAHPSARPLRWLARTIFIRRDGPGASVAMYPKTSGLSAYSLLLEPRIARLKDGAHR